MDQYTIPPVASPPEDAGDDRYRAYLADLIERVRNLDALDRLSAATVTVRGAIAFGDWPPAATS